jgi:hypothetical protein
MSLPEKTELTSMYDVPFIPPSKIKSYMESNRILKTVNDKVIPEIKKTGVQVYVVPLPLGLQGIYWVDYPMDYVEENYGKLPMGTDFLILTVYLTFDKKINYEKLPTISHILSKENKKTIPDILIKHLPLNFYWDGNDASLMEIHYSRRKTKMTKIKIDKTNIHCLNIEIVIKKSKKVNFSIIEDPELALEFKEFRKAKKLAKFCDIDTVREKMFIYFDSISVKNTEKIIKIFKIIEEKGELTYPEGVMKIKNIKIGPLYSES